MPTPNNNHRTPNANSAPAAASAAGNPQPLTATPATGPLSVSALADALVRFGSPADASPTNAQAAASAAAPAPEPGAAADGQVQQTDPVLSNAAAPDGATADGQATDGQPADGQPADGQPTDGQPADGQPDDGASPEGVEGVDDLTPGVSKRIGQLQSQIRELQEKLTKAETNQARPEATPQNQVLSEITDPGELDRRESLTRNALREIQTKLEDLRDDPQAIEQYLRANRIELRDETGQEDFSERRMRLALRQYRDFFQGTLEAFPARRAYLQNFTQAHAQVVKAVPWVADKTDPRHAQMQQVLSQFPALKAAPNHEYWVACAIMGHNALAARTRQPAAQPARPAAVQGARSANGSPQGPRTAAGGTAPPRVNPDKAKVEAARTAVTKDGSRAALAGFLDATGFGPPASR